MFKLLDGGRPSFKDSEVEIGQSNIVNFYHMTEIANLNGILETGLLSHNAMREGDYADVSSSSVQDRRKQVTLPDGRKLHDCVCMYLNPHNAMMYVVRGRKDNPSMCVLELSARLMELEGVYFSDCNAAVDGVSFSTPSEFALPGEKGAMLSNERSVFWEDNKSYMRKQTRQAEFLVPDLVPPEYIRGILVPNNDLKLEVQELLSNLEMDHVRVKIVPSMFFMKEGSLKSVPLKEFTPPSSPTSDGPDYGAADFADAPPTSDQLEEASQLGVFPS